MSHFYEFGPFRLDVDKRLLQKNGEPVALTPKAIDTLFVLVENPREVLEKERLMKTVWGDSFVEEGNLTVNISTLRKVLGERPNQPQYIMTVPGRGYRFVAYVKESFEGDSEIIVQESTRSQILIRTSEAEVQEAVASETAPRGLLTRILRRDGKAGPVTGQRAKRVAIISASLALLVLFALVPQALKVSTGKAIKSVAVLPFVNETNDDSTEYLGDSFADMLISGLSRLPELKVISRNSVARYRGQEADAVSVGGELKVRALVIGRLYKVGNQLCVVVELTDTSDGTVLWSEKYDQNSSNTLSIQQDIARNIISKLRKESGGEAKEVLATQATRDPAAYDLYLKGRWYWNKRTWPGVKQAIAYYEQALELDPDFALAYAGLADVYALTGGVLPRDSYLKAKAAAERALQLDETLGEAHATLGFIKSHYDRDWAAADAEFRRAIELSPNHPTAHHWNASQLMARGEFDPALQEFNRALELDPLSPIINTDLGLCHFFRRDYDAAVAHLQRVCDQFPGFYMAHYHLAWAYTQKGTYENAVAEYQRALELSKGHSMVEAMLGYTYALSGRRGEAEGVLAKLQELARGQYVSPYRFAMIYTALGEKDHAFEWLNRACDESDFLVIYAGVSPFTDPLRGDPRFTEVLRRLHLAP